MKYEVRYEGHRDFIRKVRRSHFPVPYNCPGREAGRDCCFDFTNEEMSPGWKVRLASLTELVSDAVKSRCSHSRIHSLLYLVNIYEGPTVHSPWAASDAFKDFST